MFTYSSFSVVLILVTLCPLTTMFFFEMLVQLAIRIYTKNDARADFIRYLLTVGGFYRNALSDKWEKLCKDRIDAENSKSAPHAMTISDKSATTITDNSTYTSKNKPNKTKIKLAVYTVLTLLTIILTVLPGIASWLISKTSTQEVVTSTLLKREVDDEVDEFIGTLIYNETRTSKMNYANAVSITYLNVLSLINTTRYDRMKKDGIEYVKPSLKDKIFPYTVDVSGMLVDQSLKNDSNYAYPYLSPDEAKIPNIAYTGGPLNSNDFIKKNFKPIPSIVQRDIDLRNNGSFVDTSLFYYEGENDLKCFLTISDHYDIYLKPFGKQKNTNEPGEFTYENFIKRNTTEFDLLFLQQPDPFPSDPGFVEYMMNMYFPPTGNGGVDTLFEHLEDILDKTEDFYPMILRVLPTFTQVINIITIHSGPPYENNGEYETTFYFRRIGGRQNAEVRCNKEFELSQDGKMNDPSFGFEKNKAFFVFDRSDMSDIIEKSALVAYENKEMSFKDIINSSKSSNPTSEKPLVIYHAKFLSIWVIITSVVSLVLFAALYIFPMRVSGGDMMREIVSFKRCDTDLASLITEPNLPSANLVVGTTYNDDTDLNHIGLVEKKLDNTQKEGKSWYGTTLL